MVEGAILGKPVLSLLTPEFAGTQEGTLHFHYLLPENGGFLRVANTLDAHEAQLADALANPAAVRKQSERFVGGFLRPRGLATPCTPFLADAFESAASRRPAPRRESIGTKLLRLIVFPLALVVSWAGDGSKKKSKKHEAVDLSTRVARTLRETRKAVVRPLSRAAEATRSAGRGLVASRVEGRSFEPSGRGSLDAAGALRLRDARARDAAMPRAGTCAREDSLSRLSLRVLSQLRFGAARAGESRTRDSSRGRAGSRSGTASRRSARRRVPGDQLRRRCPCATTTTGAGSPRGCVTVSSTFAISTSCSTTRRSCAIDRESEPRACSSRSATSCGGMHAGRASRRRGGCNGSSARIPEVPAIHDYIRRQAPDVVLITPLITLGSSQIDYLRAAKSLRHSDR
jgi:hypothetical protein